MMTKKIIPLLLLTATFTACNNNEEMNNISDRQKMQIAVELGETDNRAAITGATLPGNSSIGIILVDATDATYDNITYNNIKATANNATPQQWTLASDVFLSATPGKVTAYYPYNSGITNLSQMTVTAGETDFMWASPDNSVKNSEPKVILNMNHALTAIRVALKRGTYTGTGKVTAVSVAGKTAGTTGKLNAWNGALSDVKNGGTAVSIAPDMTLTETAKNADIIVVPTGTKSALTLTIVADGRTYTITTDEVTLIKGQMYKYVVTLDSELAKVESVAINDWGYNDSGTATIK